jgi:hypothetical protein
MKAQTIDDLVDRLALGAEGDADEVEVFRRDLGYLGPIALSWFVAKSSCV